MNKSDLVTLLAETNGLTKSVAERALTTMVRGIVDTLAKGGTVKLVGFGTFKVATRPARTGYNPMAKAKIRLPSAVVPRFTPGAGFRAAVAKVAATLPLAH